MQHRLWRMRASLSSGLTKVEHFLVSAGYDRAPWMVAGFAGGIAAWFALGNAWQWLGLIFLSLGIALISQLAMREDGRFPMLRVSLCMMALMLAAGCALIWAKSAIVGTPAIARPQVTMIEARVLERKEQPANSRVRLLLATREPGTGRAIRVRLNLDIAGDRDGLREGAVIRARARLVPPAPPMLPGGYDFARAAWFAEIAATGSVLGEVQIIEPATSDGTIAAAQRVLSHHVRANLDGTPGTIAAALVSGDRGAIDVRDEDAMRDSGLTHLLSISGLHVSAVIAAVYFLTLKVLALWPWLALRVRLPLAAAGAGALAGIGYTLLTGSEVPTIRSCIGAVLVLAALALGREPLSMRMAAAAAAIVLVFWPEALAGPSFQMSFAAVIAIIALHGSDPVRAFLAPREEGWWTRGLRRLAMLFLTGVVIELALMPIGLFHFHRAGVYGALANVIAIPLTTFVTMPLIALALLFDAFGAGAPFWWLTGKSVELLLALARWTAARPGAVTMIPAMGQGAFALFLAGGLWLALWRGKVRLWGLLPTMIGMLLLANLRAPDVLISGDGRHVGITGEAGDELLVLRESRSDYVKENLSELAGMSGDVRPVAEWPRARCNADFCAIVLERGGRNWRLLIARSHDLAPARSLAAACERADIVIAARRLPRACHPRWLKADREFLAYSGGLALDLTHAELRSVAQGEGSHGWWRPTGRFAASPESSATSVSPAKGQYAPLAPLPPQ